MSEERAPYKDLHAFLPKPARTGYMPPHGETDLVETARQAGNRTAKFAERGADAVIVTPAHGGGWQVEAQWRGYG